MSKIGITWFNKACCSMFLFWMWWWWWWWCVGLLSCLPKNWNSCNHLPSSKSKSDLYACMILSQWWVILFKTWRLCWKECRATSFPRDAFFDYWDMTYKKWFLGHLNHPLKKSKININHGTDIRITLEKSSGTSIWPRIGASRRRRRMMASLRASLRCFFDNADGSKKKPCAVVYPEFFWPKKLGSFCMLRTPVTEFEGC